MKTNRQAYLTDFSDADWKGIEHFFPKPSKMGRPREHPYRELMNGICYILRSGCAWELLPHDLPPHKTVYHYYNQWAKEGLFEKMNLELVPIVRELEGRSPDPTAGIIDSQTARTVQVPGLSV